LQPVDVLLYFFILGLLIVFFRGLPNLSTDTEVDEAYYTQLKPYLSGDGKLQFDQCQELTTFQPGYFWEH